MDIKDTGLERTRKSIEQLLMAMMPGGTVLKDFNDPKTVELLVNDDCSYWVEKLGTPLTYKGIVPAAIVMSLIKQVSGAHEQIVDYEHPVCEGEFPLDGSRFEGLIPPIVKNPSFSLRKKASAIFTVEQYVQQGIMTQKQKELIENMIKTHKNMLICGGTGSGKTTLINGIIEKMVHLCPDDRIVIIEDTGEIQCSAKDKIQLRATSFTSMTLLLKATLRLRPDRILVGEVRGGEALDLLDAWNTGHPGGMATVHANNAVEALDRIKALISRNPSCPKEGVEKQIAAAINAVINIVRTKGGRTIKELIEVKGYDANRNEYVFNKIA